MKRLIVLTGALALVAMAAAKFGPDLRRELKIYSM